MTLQAGIEVLDRGLDADADADGDGDGGVEIMTGERERWLYPSERFDFRTAQGKAR